MYHEGIINNFLLISLNYKRHLQTLYNIKCNSNTSTFVNEFIKYTTYYQLWHLLVPSFFREITYIFFTMFDESYIYHFFCRFVDVTVEVTMT